MRKAIQILVMLFAVSCVYGLTPTLQVMSPSNDTLYPSGTLTITWNSNVLGASVLFYIDTTAYPATGTIIVPIMEGTHNLNAFLINPSGDSYKNPQAQVSKRFYAGNELPASALPINEAVTREAGKAAEYVQNTSVVSTLALATGASGRQIFYFVIAGGIIMGSLSIWVLIKGKKNKASVESAKQYIAKYGANYRREDITTSLETAGYSRKEIEKAFVEISKTTPGNSPKP